MTRKDKDILVQLVGGWVDQYEQGSLDPRDGFLHLVGALKSMRKETEDESFQVYEDFDILQEQKDEWRYPEEIPS